MKLVCIYNVWDDWDLLELSMANMRPRVDGFIVVWSKTSNFGEVSEPPALRGDHFYNYEPDLSLQPVENERAKRNYGLEIAKKAGFSHFLMMDADEFYDPDEFLKAKAQFKNPDLAGMVCGVKCYFGRPDLTIGFDVTRVPFIHRITPDLCFTWNRRYPFAFHGPKMEIRIDPTRQLNINEGVQWSDITMHHASWIRKDPAKKVRNSTARVNIERSTIFQDLSESAPGYFCQFYNRILEPCSDLEKIWASAKANS